MLSRLSRGTRIKLLIILVTTIATFTWIAIFWNYDLVEVNTRIKTIQLQQLKTQQKQIKAFEISQSTDKLLNPTTRIYTGSNDPHSTSIITQTNHEIKNTKRCTLDWSFPYINITHYERIQRKIPKISRRDKVEALFKNTTVHLNGDKFLYPVGRWGPNNQMFGFYEAIFVAITLNRTFVLPRFIKHHLDKQRHSTDYTSPSQYVDVEYYCKFLSCITLETFQKTCGFQFDKIMNTKYLRSYHFDDIKRNLGMNFPAGMSDMSEILLPKNGASKSNKELTFTPDEIKTYFKTSARCVVYPYPILDLRTYNSKGDRVKLHLSRSAKPYHKARNLSLPDGVDLFESILQHYKRPLFIRQLAEDFLQNATEGSPFLSIHWRYNEGDFLSKHHCNDQEINKKICSRAKAFTVEDFARKIGNKLQSLKSKGFNLKKIYFAAPPDTLKLINTLSRRLSLNQGVDIFSSRELMQLIKLKYKECKFLTKHFDDVISTTEMEICSRGLAFLGSQGTTWTSNVIKSRSFANIDGIRPEFDDMVFTSTLKD